MKTCNIAVMALVFVSCAGAAARNPGNIYLDGKPVALKAVYAYRDANDDSVYIVFADKGSQVKGDRNDQFYMDTLESAMAVDDGATVVELHISQDLKVKTKYLVAMNYPGTYPDDPYRLSLDRFDDTHIAGRFVTTDAKQKDSGIFFDLAFDIDLNGHATHLHTEPPPPPPPPQPDSSGHGL
ncbi:MAG: hypothetical protein WBV39_04595 [Rudaea sp.]